MADNQVRIFLSSTKELSRNKRTYSSTARSSLPRKPLPASGTSRTSDWDSKPPRKPSNLNTSTKNAPSPAVFPSEDRSSRVSSSPPRCKGPSSSGVTISTMSPNTTDMKRDIETSQCTAPQPSQSRKEISSLLVNADPSPKLSTSMFSKLSPTKSWVTSESNSCSFDLMAPYYCPIISLFHFLLMNPSQGNNLNKFTRKTSERILKNNFLQEITFFAINSIRIMQVYFF